MKPSNLTPHAASLMRRLAKHGTGCLLLALATSFAWSPVEGREARNRNSPAPVLIEWDSAESAERLFRSSYNQDFFPLSNHFVSQDNKIFCGLASSAMVLNALRLGKKGGLPQDQQSIREEERAWIPEGLNPFFGKYTANNVLSDATKTRIEVLGKPIEIAGELKRDMGLQLRQLAQALRSHRLEVAVRVVDEHASPDVVRREVVENLGRGGDFVLVNYSRKALGQTGGGHISPLGAYDEHTDSFLIMDVNPNRAPWVWVESAALIEAMRSFDTVENRGYLLISDPE